ncbi:MAG: thiolase family protein [Streptococcaceae bacterium]|jgi:hydroxymethylglutaryl-CoA reductase/acetyl-CoA C-acetyltransferase|nr:thiolase family protein [Streptococcaceae bacterium]
MTNVVIVDAVRTPFGKFKGSLSNLTARDLGILALSSLIKRVPATLQADEVIFGNVLSAGLGQNIARQISIGAGLSVEVPAFTVNEVCGSSMKAIQLARQAILVGDAEIVIAGGTESMSNASTMAQDGLTDAFLEVPMGVTVEKLAQEYAISRSMQDAFALESHRRAGEADFSHELTEPDAPLETIRTGTTPERMAELIPVFTQHGTITAGNASPVNDGAAAVLLASEEAARRAQLPILAYLRDVVEVGVEPEHMGLSPIKALQRLTEKTGVALQAVDRFEINEAFAASSLIINNELGLDPEKVNVNGGAIALGHPLGATGARLIGTLAHQLYDNHEHYGMASLCIGGGLGLAALLENASQ